jgi:hypothetical protein
MLRRVLAVAPLVALGLACLACDSPTLPLPPPMVPTITAGASAHEFVLTATCGGAEAGAVIIIENTDTNIANDQRISGALASSCGAWNATVYANYGDVLNVTQDDGTVVSSPEVVQIPQQP